MISIPTIMLMGLFFAMGQWFVKDLFARWDAPRERELLARMLETQRDVHLCPMCGVAKHESGYCTDCAETRPSPFPAAPVAACPMCAGDGQVCNECEKPGAVCQCPESNLPTPMPCPACVGREPSAAEGLEMTPEADWQERFDTWQKGQHS